MEPSSTIGWTSVSTFVVTEKLNELNEIIYPSMAGVLRELVASDQNTPDPEEVSNAVISPKGHNNTTAATNNNHTHTSTHNTTAPTTIPVPKASPRLLQRRAVSASATPIRKRSLETTPPNNKVDIDLTALIETSHAQHPQHHSQQQNPQHETREAGPTEKDSQSTGHVEVEDPEEEDSVLKQLLTTSANLEEIPLSDDWLFWYSFDARRRGLSKREYLSNMTRTFSFRTFGDFMSCWTNTILNALPNFTRYIFSFILFTITLADSHNTPHQNTTHSLFRLLLFKKDICPLWEHPRNRRGGKFAVPLSEGHEKALKSFLQLCVALIYGKIAYDEVCTERERERIILVQLKK